MTKPTALEKITSSLPIKGAANAVGVFGATITPLAAFVPFLVESLASGRHANRLEGMFQELQALTERNAEQIKNLSDDQYKVVNEAISAAFYTISQEKIGLLKTAATNALLHPNIVADISDSLSRAIRDISAAEAAFMVRSFGYELIIVAKTPFDIPQTNVLTITPHSDEEVILSGLINLGLLYSKTPRFDIVAFEWSPLTAKLIVLLNDA